MKKINDKTISDYLKETGDKAELLDALEPVVKNLGDGKGCYGCNIAKIYLAIENAYSGKAFDLRGGLLNVRDAQCELHAREEEIEDEKQLLGFDPYQ